MNIKARILKLIARKSYSNDFQPEEFKKILIVRTAKIGDTVCMFPLIREIKKAFPSAQIDIYASIHNNFMFKHMEDVTNVFTMYSRKHIIRHIIDLIRIRRNHYDLVIDTMEMKFGKIIMLLLINPSWIIGSEGRDPRYGIRHADLQLYYKLVDWKNIHMTELLLSFLDALGIHQYDNRMQFYIDDDSISHAKSFLNKNNYGKIIGINADASSTERSILDHELIDLCKEINRHIDGAMILLFSPPSKRHHIRHLVEGANLDNVILEDSAADIFDAAALVSLLDVVITPNTSFVHIASAFNVPVVAIFQNDPVDINYWAPRSDKHAVIHPEGQSASIRGFNIKDTVSAAISFMKPG